MSALFTTMEVTGTRLERWKEARLSVPFADRADRGDRTDGRSERVCFPRAPHEVRGLGLRAGRGVRS